MNPLRDVTLCILGLSLAASSSSLSQHRDRSKIPESYRWNLADLFPSDEAWEKAKQAFSGKIGAPGKEEGVMEQFRGKLSKSPRKLLACLDLSSDLGREFARLSVYAGMASDQDTRDPKYLGMVQAMGQIGSTFGAKVAYIEPEILKMGKLKIRSFLGREPKLKVYRHNLDDVLRRKSHTGTEPEEKIIADASLMADAADNIYGIFSNAEFPYPSVTLSDGKTVKLDKAAFTLYRAVPDREDRKKVFQSFFGKINEFRATFGTQLYAEVKKTCST